MQLLVQITQLERCDRGWMRFERQAKMGFHQLTLFR